MTIYEYITKNLPNLNWNILPQIFESEGVELTEDIEKYLRETPGNTNWNLFRSLSENSSKNLSKLIFSNFQEQPAEYDFMANFQAKIPKTTLETDEVYYVNYNSNKEYIPANNILAYNSSVNGIKLSGQITISADSNYFYCTVAFYQPDETLKADMLSTEITVEFTQSNKKVVSVDMTEGFKTNKYFENYNEVVTYINSLYEEQKELDIIVVTSEENIISSYAPESPYISEHNILSFIYTGYGYDFRLDNIYYWYDE